MANIQVMLLAASLLLNFEALPWTIILLDSMHMHMPCLQPQCQFSAINCPDCCFPLWLWLHSTKYLSETSNILNMEYMTKDNWGKIQLCNLYILLWLRAYSSTESFSRGVVISHCKILLAHMWEECWLGCQFISEIYTYDKVTCIVHWCYVRYF